MQLTVRGNKYHATGYYWDARTDRRRRWRKSTGVWHDGTKRTERVAEQTAHQIAQSFATGGGRRGRTLSLQGALKILIGDLERADRAQASIDIVNEKTVHLFNHFGPDFDCADFTKANQSAYADARLKQVARSWEKEQCAEHGKKRKLCGDDCVMVPRKTFSGQCFSSSICGRGCLCLKRGMDTSGYCYSAD